MAQMSGSADNIQSFPLYHTTGIGRAASSDIRIKKRGILRHHAQIYLYNGRWYLDRVSPDAKIQVNHEPLKRKKRLKHQDLISLPGIQLIFIDERESAAELGVDFEETWTEEKRLFERDEKTPLKAWILMCLFYLLIFFRLLSIVPDDKGALLPLVFIIGMAFFIMINTFGAIWKRLFDHFDMHIFTALSQLAGLGLLLQMRLSILNRSMPQNGDWTDQSWILFLQKDLIKQSMFAFIGLIIMPIIIYIISRTRWLELIAPLCVVLTPLLYVITKLMGRDVAGTGAGLWIVLPMGFTVQLTEFAKITYLVVLAWFFMIRPPLKRQWLFAAWAGLNFMLMLILPDLGSMMILLPVTLLVFTVMTSEYFKTFIILAGGCGIFALAWQFLPYVRRRIHGWLTLWDEVNAQNDQIIRGLQAIGRGGLFGIGLGEGEPRSIPLASSDMIFSFMTEEFGLLVALSLVILFMLIWLRGAYASTVIRDGFSSALILGVAAYFFIEAAVVIGGCTGLIPLTGATLPFIARGGSSMLAKWILAAILLGLWNRREEGAYKK